MLETIYDVLFKPRQAFLAIRENPKPWYGFFVVVVNSVLLGIAVTTEDIYFGGGAQVLMSFAQLIFNLMSWFIMTAIWHLVAELNGGKGQAKALLTAVGYSYFPQLLLLPVYLISNFLSFDMASALLTISGLGLIIWVIVLEIFAIQAVYSVSGAKATLIFLLPVIALFVGITLFVIMVGMVAMSIMKGSVLPPSVF